MPTVKKSIHAKLIDARNEFHSSSIVKTGYNSFSKYNFFELSDFLVPAMQILASHDLLPVISFQEELATMTVYDAVNGESIVITSPMSTATLKACQPVQSMGACQTFVRRYLYVTLMEIVEHDVLEESAGKPDNKKQQKSEPLATDEQKAIIDDYIAADKAAGTTIVPPRRSVWVGRNKDRMTESQAATIIKECKESK